jgi:hypothetical protein
MRIGTKYLVAITVTCIILITLNCASAVGDEKLDLKSLVTAFEDARMDSQDLAFYLATHDFDAAPRDGYVELNLYGKTYRMTPNGNKPGLCDIEPEIMD